MILRHNFRAGCGRSVSMTLKFVSCYRQWTPSLNILYTGDKLDLLAINLTTYITLLLLFHVHISVHHNSMYLEDQQDAALSGLYLFYCQVTLQVSGVSRTHHQEYTNCSYNHWYKS